jgi:hypothetical protein
MEVSEAVRDAVLGFYGGVTNKEVERFDELVSAHPATLVIGTAPGEWITERKRLRFGFEAEGLEVEPGPAPIGYAEGTLGWFADEPRFVLPDGTGFRTRLTAVLRQENGHWKIVHMHWSAGVPDGEVVALQQRWGID